MPLKIFIKLFPKLTIEQFCATESNTVVLKIYIDSNIEQLGICRVKLRQTDNDTKCRFIIVLGNGPVL